jgi:hypothetical protein
LLFWWILIEFDLKTLTLTAQIIMYEAETILNRFVRYQYVKNDTKHDMSAMSGFRDMLIDQFAGAVSHASIWLNIGFTEKCYAKKLLEIKF